MLAILSLSIFAQSAHHIISRAFYALENTKTPFIIALVAMATNVSLSAYLTFKVMLTQLQGAIFKDLKIEDKIYTATFSRQLESNQNQLIQVIWSTENTNK